LSAAKVSCCVAVSSLYAVPAAVLELTESAGDAREDGFFEGERVENTGMGAKISAMD
jgi:hypothetical protein